MATAPTISLTAQESSLLTLLSECASWIDKTDELKRMSDLPDAESPLRNWKLAQDTLADGQRDKVVLRVAGGWVRDKLLGRPSDDIDISTSPYPLTGFAFAELLRRYCTEVINKPEYIGKVAKIEANPLQSKHLETATVPILGFSVDFVQLRGGEVYDEGSRIPNAVQFGTALEDAQRRDLTINALFYNLTTSLVEDQTQLGLLDLGYVSPSTRLIRTPLEPFQTFRDDPLRVIRAVRFASRFGGMGFVIDQSLRDAVGREEIRDALRDSKKISRERVGSELIKMLKGPNPLLALSLIETLDLHPLIFLYDRSALVPPIQANPDYSLTLRSATIINTLLSLSPSTASLPPLHPLLSFEITEQPNPPAPHVNTITTLSRSTDLKRIYLSAGLLPLYHLIIAEGKNKKLNWVGERVIKEGLKGNNVERVWVIKARESASLLKNGVAKFCRVGRASEETDRAEIGLLLRHTSVHDVGDGTGERGATWNMSLLWSLVAELASLSSETEQIGAIALIESYNRFIEIVLSYNLQDRAFDKPLLNGNEINELLPQTKNSPATTFVQALVISYQLGHPTSTREDCAHWLVNSESGSLQVEKILKSVQATMAECSKGNPKKKKQKSIE